MANLGFGPIVGMNVPGMGMQQPRKRSWQSRLFDRLNPQQDGGPFAVNDDDKKSLVRQGLLQLGVGLLQNNSMAQGLGAGLQGGLLAMNQGANDLRNDRYQQQMMARTMSGMDRNNRVEALQGQLTGPDGSINEAKFRELAAIDPQAAKAYRDAVQPQTRWQLGRVGDGAGGEVDVLFDPMDPSQMRTLDGQQIAGGQQQMAAPTTGAGPMVMGGAYDQAVGAPDQVQQTYDALAAAFPGTQISSRQRSPQHNQTVGGVPNSQHITGTAADFVVPQPQRQAFIADARKRGFEAIDEGDHVHLEQPPRTPGIMPPRVGTRPKVRDKTEDFRTMTPAEVREMGLPDGTVAQVSPKGQVQIVNKPKDLPTGGQVIDNGDGTTTFIPQGKLTEGERNAAGFYQRMLAANKEMADLGYDPVAVDNLGDYYTAGGKLGNFLTSPKGQQYRQAQENWVRANLRKESGAAIGVAEMEQERKNYFPIPGDSPEVVKQKARNREVVQGAMRTAAGGALPPMKAAPDKAGKKEVRRGKYQGRTVIQYADGSVEYAD